MAGEMYIISSDALDRVEALMKTMHERVRVKNSMLMDRGGYVFHHAGVYPFLPAQEIGAIVSGAFASLNTLVSMSAANVLTVKFHGSPMGCLILLPVTNRTLLAIGFDDEVSDEKSIREQAEQFVVAARPHIELDETSGPDMPGSLPFSSVEYIEGRLNDLFDNI